jgi:uncharacterized protein
MNPQKEFSVALPIAVALLAGFALLQYIGLADIVSTDGSAHYSRAFIIGLLASVSSCMAVVGGLILSFSATYEKAGKSVRPQVLFHIGRIVAFFILGGVIGAIGTTFTLSIMATFLLSLIVGIVMLILGIRLLDIFPWADRLQILMPDSVSDRMSRAFGSSDTYGPLVLGIATFFMPCGFTQSMQVYTLSSGGFLAGGLTMLLFALGTLPILALVSFGSLSVHGSPYRGVYLKVAGLIVVAFALFNIWNGLASIGLVPVVF